jgi:UDP-N-acetylmuramoylalanine--D-glutamate ligase
MFALENKNVLVIGLGVSGVAATELLLSRGAKVVAVDSSNNEMLRKQAKELRGRGVHVELGWDVDTGTGARISCPSVAIRNTRTRRPRSNSI